MCSQVFSKLCLRGREARWSTFADSFLCHDSPILQLNLPAGIEVKTSATGPNARHGLQTSPWVNAFLARKAPLPNHGRAHFASDSNWKFCLFPTNSAEVQVPGKPYWALIWWFLGSVVKLRSAQGCFNERMGPVVFLVRFRRENQFEAVREGPGHGNPELSTLLGPHFNRRTFL